MSYAALAVGGSAVVAKDISVGAVMPLMRHHQPTVLAMMPYALTEMVYASEDSDPAFQNLRMCDCGGDKVATDLQKKFQEVSGVELAEGYGLTEAGIVTHNRPDGPIVHGSVGPAMPGNEFSVRDPNGKDLPAGEEGVLWIRSPSVMSGYFGDPAATAEVIEDGWLNTGDLLRFDDQGYFWFCGRKKQIIIHDGSNISPQEVENVLLQHDAIEAAAVVGVPDTLHGQNIRAYVVLKPGDRGSCRRRTYLKWHVIVLATRRQRRSSRSTGTPRKRRGQNRPGCPCQNGFSRCLAKSRCLTGPTTHVWRLAHRRPFWRENGLSPSLKPCHERGPFLQPSRLGREITRLDGDGVRASCRVRTTNSIKRES